MKGAQTIRREPADPAVADRGSGIGQLETELELERSLCSTILDTVPALIVVLDRDSRIVRLNRSCEMSTGFRVAELKGKEVWPLFYTEEDANSFRGALKCLTTDAQPARFESCWKQKDGSPITISWTVTALFDRNCAIRLIIATGMDVTENKRLENAVLEISSREQRSIGQDLHDGLGQHLTGIAFLAKVQEQKLIDKSLPEAAEAAKIVRLVNEAIRKTRELARGLIPVLSGPHGLISALQEWAGELEDIFRIECRFECDNPFPIRDDGAANQLFYIAQEAAHNAIRHGHATKIIIALRSRDEEGVLTIRDDGSGFAFDSACAGMGLRIMHYRARMIGGRFNIENVGPRGTLVTCLFPIQTWAS